MTTDYKAQWEIVRNKTWIEQESFVKSLFDKIVVMESIIEIIRNDKYASTAGFKHIEGTIGEYIETSMGKLQ